MPRWERAWEYFQAGLCDGVFHQPGYCHKIERYDRRGENYRTVLALVQSFGIKVYVQTDLGKSRDRFGQEFQVGGHWNAWKTEIRLTYRNVPTLNHELVHACDYMVRGYGSGSAGELVACSVGYLLTCQQMGIRSPEADVTYARRQGATPHKLKTMEGHILSLYHQINQLLQTQGV
jgi:hypothetical protein